MQEAVWVHNERGWKASVADAQQVDKLIRELELPTSMRDDLGDFLFASMQPGHLALGLRMSRVKKWAKSIGLSNIGHLNFIRSLNGLRWDKKRRLAMERVRKISFNWELKGIGDTSLDPKRMSAFFDEARE